MFFLTSRNQRFMSIRMKEVEKHMEKRALRKWYDDNHRKILFWICLGLLFIIPLAFVAFYVRGLYNNPL